MIQLDSNLSAWAQHGYFFVALVCASLRSTWSIEGVNKDNKQQKKRITFSRISVHSILHDMREAFLLISQWMDDTQHEWIESKSNASAGAQHNFSPILEHNNVFPILEHYFFIIAVIHNNSQSLPLWESVPLLFALKD